MKKAFLRKLTVITLCVIVISLCVVSVSAVGSTSRQNTQPRHQICTELPKAAKEYYTGVYSYENLSQLSGAQDTSTSRSAMQDNELYSALHELMADTHVYYTTYSGYKNGSLAYFWAQTDTTQSGNSYVMFYSDILSGEGVTMNREHIWPKSCASFYQKNGGADLHHLRPSIASLNNAKSDHTFGYISGTYSDGYKEGVINNNLLYYVSQKRDLFECKDDVKGDVARILLYVYCRWQQPNLYTTLSEGLPAFDQDDDKNSGKKVIEDLDTLLLWCENDPVDTWEMERNNLTEEVQGNRNVFIDYPELAWQLFSRDLPTGMSTPTHIGCQHQYEEIARRQAGCITDGYFTLKCTVCGNEYQRKLPSQGGHLDEDNDGICERCGEPVDGKFLLLGDSDGDGAVSVLDATAIQKTLASLSVPDFFREAADADEDRTITVIDATYIQKWLAKIPCNDTIGKPIGKT